MIHRSVKEDALKCNILKNQYRSGAVSRLSMTKKKIQEKLNYFYYEIAFPPKTPTNHIDIIDLSPMKLSKKIEASFDFVIPFMKTKTGKNF